MTHAAKQGSKQAKHTQYGGKRGVSHRQLFAACGGRVLVPENRLGARRTLGYDNLRRFSSGIGVVHQRLQRDLLRSVLEHALQDELAYGRPAVDRDPKLGAKVVDNDRHISGEISVDNRAFDHHLAPKAEVRSEKKEEKS